MALLKKSDKSFGSPMWSPLGWGDVYGSRSLDYFGSEREPSKAELILGYRDVVYSCVSLISETVGFVPLNLYAQTDRGQSAPKAIYQPKALNSIEQKRLKNSRVHTKAVRAKEIVQITDHPLIDLLSCPNSEWNYYDLMSYSTAFLLTTGNVYWQIVWNKLGLPQELWLLPSHQVRAVPDASGFVAYYQYAYASEPMVLKSSDVIHIKYPDLRNAYTDGMPPLVAIWEPQSLANKEMSLLGAQLQNSARFDGVLTPEQPLGYYESERLSKDITARFRGAGSGGIFVAPEKMTFYPISWTPRDLAELELYNRIKVSICNAFKVPPSLLESGANRAEKESDAAYLARYCILPLLVRLASKMTSRLAAMYDPRLWLEFDDPIPTNKETELAEKDRQIAQFNGISVLLRDVYSGNVPVEAARQTATTTLHIPEEEAAAIFPEEVEEEVDFEALAVASTPKPSAQDIINLQREVFSGAIPASAATATAITVWGLTPEEAAALFPEITKTTPEPEEPDIAPQVFQLQQAYYAGQLPREAAIADCVVLYEMDEQQAETLFPEKQETAPDASESSPADSGAGDEIDAPDSVPDAGKGAGLDIPDIRQETDHDCGAACIRAVLAFFGQDRSEADCIEALGTTHETGTSSEAMVKYLNQCGLKVELLNHLGGDQLQEHTANGKPIIALVNEGTHWVVACGGEGDSVTYHDPLKGRSSTNDFKASTCLVVSKEEKKCLHCYHEVKSTPVGKKIAKVLKKYFKVQRNQILDRVKNLKSLSEFQTKSLTDDYRREWYEWADTKAWNIKVDLSNWSEPMAKELLPLVMMTGQEGILKTVERLGNPEGLAPVVEPKLKEALQKATLQFCEDTNATTSMQLEAAITKLREKLGDAIEQGQQRNELAKTVQEVFDFADRDRALRIAVTEESRARHCAADIAAKESGLVKGTKWLISSMPCELCEPLADKEVPLGEPFAVDGKGPYAKTYFPPRHPNCQCTVVEVLND